MVIIKPRKTLMLSIFLLCLLGVQSFQVGVRPSITPRRGRLTHMQAQHSSAMSGSSRRRLLQDGVAAALGLSLLGLTGPFQSGAANAAEEGTIAVLGARGRTARLIVQGLLKLGKPVRAVTREPFTYPTSEIDEDLASKLTYAIGDVTKPDTLNNAVKGASAAVFASSFSKKGGTAEQVDYQGVVNAAHACLDNDVSRYLIISSGAVSRPDSFGYKVTNLFQNVMEYKKRGEDEVRLLYAKSASPKQSYTIVRPGGLSNDKPRGVAALEINQNDTIIGEIARADVADACVNALLTKETENATFEVYETKRRAPLQPEFPSTSGYEHHGSTWAEVFVDIKTDKELGILPSAAA